MCKFSRGIKGARHGILKFFDHRQNYLQIEENLIILLYKDGKNTKDGDREDRHGLQTTNLKNFFKPFNPNVALLGL